MENLGIKKHLILVNRKIKKLEKGSFVIEKGRPIFLWAF